MIISLQKIFAASTFDSVSMRDYLNSKIAQYPIVLEQMECEIGNLQLRNHNHLINCLRDKIKELREQCERLRIISNISEEMLIPRSLTIIHYIEYQIFVLSYYIPGLKKEDTNDLFLRSLLRPIAKRCGLSWVRDILVRLDMPYATFSGLTEFPIIFAPTQQATSVYDIASIYHELGHNVFQHFGKIADNLATTINRYFSELKQKVGPMSPKKRAERERAINEATDYWGIERLNEIFSDIYATFVCGPAYSFSCVSMAMSLSGDPFHISPTDVHPPSAARVYACYKTLLPDYQSDEIVISIQNIWNTYADTQTKPPDFGIKCANELIQQLVSTSIQNIERMIPNVQRYSEPLKDLSESKSVSPSEPLETILNKRITILLKDPEYYAEWEKNVFKTLRRESSQHAC